MTNRKFRSTFLYALFVAGVVVLSLAVQPSMAAYFVQPSAYWQLEETDPGSSGVVDQLGVANGLCTGTECPTSGTGQIGSGFVFDGTDDNVVIDGSAADVFDFAAGASFTIEMWVKRDGAPGTIQALIGRYSNATSSAFWVGIDTDGTAACDFWDADGPYTTTKFNGYSNITDNQWHHLVVVRDGTNDKMMIYVDSVLEAVSDQSANNNTDGSFDSTANVTFGKLGSSLRFAGSLDNVAVYSANALSATIIAQDYLNGLSSHGLSDEFAPQFISSATETIALGQSATLQAAAAGNPMPTYSSAVLPAGASIDTAGVITWLPSDTQLGANLFTVSASNSQGAGSNSQSWAVTVEDLCISSLNAYWQLEETDPETSGVVDQLGATNGICAAGECPTSATGQVGNGFVFDGTDDKVVFDGSSTDVFDFAAASSFSIELWVKRDGAPGTIQAMIGRYSNATSSAFWVGIDTDGTAACDFWDADGPYTTTQFNGYTNIADNQWHQIVVVRDGLNDRVLIYVDAVLEAVSDQSADDATDGSFDSTANVTLGELNNTYHFAGTLDEVAVYGTALSGAIVAQHFNADSGRYYCNGAPVIDSTEVTTGTEDVLYTYTATATDPEGDTITWSLSAAPSGMTIDSTTGEVDWTPDEGVLDGDVTILAADQYGATDSQTFHITVTAVNDAPVITGQVALSTTENTALTIALADLTVTDPDNTYPTDFTLSVQDGTNYTRNGAEITPDSGFTGTLTVPVTVNDGSLDSNTYSLQVTVTSSGSSGGDGGGSSGGCFIGTMGL